MSSQYTLISVKRSLHLRWVRLDEGLLDAFDSDFSLGAVISLPCRLLDLTKGTFSEKLTAISGAKELTVSMDGFAGPSYDKGQESRTGSGRPSSLRTVRPNTVRISIIISFLDAFFSLHFRAAEVTHRDRKLTPISHVCMNCLTCGSKSVLRPITATSYRKLYRKCYPVARVKLRSTSHFDSHIVCLDDELVLWSVC